MNRNTGLAVVLAAAQLSAGPNSDRQYLNAAVEAGKWINASQVQRAEGFVWPNDPNDPASVNTTLYNGIPGPILFNIEAFHATGNAEYLKKARSGADSLLASLGAEKDTGLYEGAAGTGFTLIELFKASREAVYEKGARQVVALLKQRAIRTPDGAHWNDTTDIISGAAGTGLFLLYAARELKDPESRDLAADAGRYLIHLGKSANDGLNWAMDPKFPRVMPNFSHGTAGVAYFLATLYRETKRTEFLDAALAGARYLISIATVEGDQCLIYHHDPDGKDLYYLGWCHGPPGSARLFYRLYQVTNDKTWLDWVKKFENALIESGIPEKQTPGFWNNVSFCCGSASVAQFSLELYTVTKDKKYLEFAKRMTAQILSKAAKDNGGLKWIQAEHRVKPELLIAQTGLMQGASGIGLWLLHLDEFEHGKRVLVNLPDNPFDL